MTEIDHTSLSISLPLFLLGTTRAVFQNKLQLTSQVNVNRKIVMKEANHKTEKNMNMNMKKYVLQDN